MRVIAGSRRGLLLRGFEGADIRPTADRVKENLFNVIAPHIPGARVLDLFAGTGGLAIEALSRGAREAVLCEKSRAAADLIIKNVAKARFDRESAVLCTDGIHYLKQSDTPFDLILLDPPYGEGLIGRALASISQRRLLTADGIIAAECDEADSVSVPAGLILQKEKKYGRTRILVLGWDFEVNV